MYRKYLIFVLGIFFLIFAPFSFLNSAQDTAIVSVFIRDGCGHCHDEKEFLSELTKELPYVEARYYNLNKSDSIELFNGITTQYNLIKGTPITLVRGQLIQGFDSPETTGKIIKDIIIHGDDDNLLFEDIIDGGAVVRDPLSIKYVCDDGEPCKVPKPSFIITLPLIGKTIDVGGLSLTSLSLVLGLVDGFNPCALWVLIMFLVILAQLGNRKKMIQYAGLFIIAEAVMYYLILNVWLTLWNFIGLNRIVTPLVGLLALGSGVYFFYKFATYKPVCNVASPEQSKKLSERAKKLIAKPLTFGVALGIVGLAFSVNVFEFACSIGIPQTYTKILELNNLSWLAQQWYMFLYIVMYVVDDFIIFGIALYSLEKIGITHSYSKWTTLLGAIIMVALGIIFLFWPEILIFS